MKERFVLGDRVKMTPRRREILHRVAFTNDIRFLPVPWFNAMGFMGRRLEPFLGRVNITHVMRQLRRDKLISWPADSDRACITLRGVTALLECCEEPKP